VVRRGVDHELHARVERGLVHVADADDVRGQDLLPGRADVRVPREVDDRLDAIEGRPDGSDIGDIADDRRDVGGMVGQRAELESINQTAPQDRADVTIGAGDEDAASWLLFHFAKRHLAPVRVAPTVAAPGVPGSCRSRGGNGGL
jgi:hypothetical protein